MPFVRFRWILTGEILISPLLFKFGVDRGTRTLILSLEGFSPTLELYMRMNV